MATKKLNKLHLFMCIAGGMLLLSSFQAHFYTDDALLHRASEAKNKAFKRMNCSETQFIEMTKEPSAGVRIFTWRCLSKTSTSSDVSIWIQSDGFPQQYSERLICNATLLKLGYMCESANDDGSAASIR